MIERILTIYKYLWTLGFSVGLFLVVMYAFAPVFVGAEWQKQNDVTTGVALLVFSALHVYGLWKRPAWYIPFALPALLFLLLSLITTSVLAENPLFYLTLSLLCIVQMCVLVIPQTQSKFNFRWQSAAIGTGLVVFLIYQFINAVI